MRGAASPGPAIPASMPDPVFFARAVAISLEEVAAIANAPLPPSADPAHRVVGVAPLETAGPSDLAYIDNAKYADALAATRAGVQILARLYPTAARPGSTFEPVGVSSGSSVHPTARLEHGAIVDPGAVVGPHAEVGSGTVVGAQ